MARTTTHAATRVYDITSVNVANVHTGATFEIPLRLRLAEVQSMVTNRIDAGIANLICQVCGLSVADCSILSEKLRGLPDSWRSGCAVEVQYDPAQRYPYAAVCRCGWRSRGYVREHAAQAMADDHVA